MLKRILSRDCIMASALHRAIRLERGGMLRSLGQRVLNMPAEAHRSGCRGMHGSAILRAEKILNKATPINPSKGGALQDFDMLQDLPRPPIAIDAVVENGFKLSDGTTFDCADGTRGCAILDGQVLTWDYTKYCTGIDIGVVDIAEEGLSLLGLLYPRPELLLVGLGGGRSRILGPATRLRIMNLGYTIEATDTLNAASNFELLATERPRQVIALLLPPTV
ncbi:uncharacterized protein V1518DRAFT_87290 [Limtongia smithiae]|uniref:uncharacterized protein n=1 Tax=Limtongia smithiae TaxID=1125753 RepID=UPI0034CE9FA2